ncbi:sperm-associated antigen 5 isoform X2 [Pezoporus flaviventris]|uniref:sperm-associated antigen 5 isoform X2 n=1 Tax=Pezoporus flaviventris TaxID=889875 RepID=UPI002AB0C720|nr:sperm-associated antigen 5 isoform X2 [Pezoporus flaviventris]
MEPPSSPTPDPCVLEPPSSPTPDPCVLELPSSPTPDPCVLEPPSNPTPGPCILEPPSSPTSGQPSIISSVPCTPNSPDSTTIAPCTPGSSGSTSSDSCTPGPPGTTSTPQEGPFHGWRVAPSDFSCSPVAPEPPSADEGVGSLPCQDTPEEAKSPSPAPQEQGPPASPPIEAGRSEPAALEGTATPIPSPEVALGAVSWVLPLVWLEKSLNSSSLLESLRHSLTLPRRDIGTNITPVPIATTGTSVTPVPAATIGTSVTPVPAVTIGTSVTPVPAVTIGTSVTPVPAVTIGTSVTPVPAVTIGTSVTPVPAVTIGTSVTPAPTAAIGTSVTPAPAATIGTSVTPVPTTVTGTFMTPRDLRESSTNTSTGPPPCAKDSAAETDSLLWHCPREQLKSLPRAELEGRLESTLIIIEALSLQLRGWNENQRALPGVGPAEQRDALTQTDVTHPKGEEIYRNLYLELRRRTDALQRQRGVEQDLHRELKTAVEGMGAWSRQRLLFQGLTDASLQSLRDEQRALAQEREQARALVSRCQALLERVPSKLQSCLEERDAMRQRADEALQAEQEASRQLEETSVALQDTVAKLEQLTVANSRLSADHSSLMTSLASLEQERDARQQERDALQQENEKQQEEMAWLAREREALQRERNGLCQELREATECREFLEQENQMSRTQLLEVEARLRSTLDTLQECSQQHEELMDSHQRLREERAALSKELESTKAELLDLQLKRNKVSWCSKDIVESKMRLQELAECLRAALQEEDDDDDAAAPSRSRAWTPVPRTPGWQTPYRVRTPACRTPMFRTPHRAIASSFVGSVLKAVCGEDADEAAGVGSAFTKDKPAATPKAIEPEDGLLESVKQLRSVVSDLAMLSCRIQDLEQSEFKALQTEISNLQLRLETVTTESQEKIDAQAATIVKLNKALRGKLESEKELQDVVKRQEEKMLQLIDKSGEVTSLKEEVFQLKRSLQRAETEAKVLWEEMREQRPKEDTVHVRERVLQQQEMGKLRLLLLEKVDENQRLSDKVQGLELRLHRIQKVLRSHEEMQEKMKEVLVAVPDVALACQEHHSLLRYLGLKPESVSKEAAEPL